MIDLLYMLIAVPVCAALASICVCRLNTLDPLLSRASWGARYFALGVVAAGVGFEALLHPQIFSTPEIKILCRTFGFCACSIALYAVLQTRWRWIGHSGKVDNAPPESNRSPLGEA